MPNEPLDGQLSVSEPRALRTPSEQVANVGNLLQLAIQSGIGADQLERLVALQEHVMAKQARDAFFRDMAGFQAECPIIGKNRSAKIRTKSGGEYGYQYADLAMVADTIKPFCEKYGFSYSFKQKFLEKGFVETICVVRHAEGHHEETSFTGSSESDSGMSAMQKAVAATTTARRLALVLAFGLSVGEDNDGRGNLPEHPNPPRDESAPKAEPRARRQSAPSFAATANNLNELRAAFDEQHLDQEGDVNAFAKFVARVTGNPQYGEVPAGGKTLGAFTLRLWTKADLDACYRALGLGGE